MKIAVLGSGGREHALGWKFAQTVGKENVWFIPGNGGSWNNVDLKVNDFSGINKFCTEMGIDLLFVGPEDPLANGIVDYFSGSSIKVFGPDKAAARLEGSKIFAKQFMKRYGVSTADFWIPQGIDEIRQVIQELGGQVVIKYDGLAAGKGVFVCSSTMEAYQALDEVHRRYGADAPFLLERKMGGQELSIIGFTDGKSIRLLQPSQDHKPAYEGDKGPNTGGMGAYCPVPICTDQILKQISEQIVQPTLKGIRSVQMDYRGVIYFGLMLTDDGPRLLEYNVRFGDPETEVILPALKSDLTELALATLNGALEQTEVRFFDEFFVDVVLASGGYPGSYEKGKEIHGLSEEAEEALVFHAGTKKENGRIVTAGGRVLNVVGKGKTLSEAIEKAYQAVNKIKFDGMFFRSDIAAKGIK